MPLLSYCHCPCGRHAITPLPTFADLLLLHRLRIDVVLNAFGLFLTCSELVLGCLTVLTFFYHSRRY